MHRGKISAEIIAAVLESSGIRHAVCSPGSRNTPLLLAFDRCQEITKHMVIDERTAAFMALGMAKTLQSPVALVCTSGTALLNYAPAIAEAYYSRVPLIVVSADRPVQWIDQDDSQTLRQYEAFSNFILKSYDIPELDENDRVMTTYANRVVNDAVMTSTGHRSGPVHINVQFDNPLKRTGNSSALPRQRIISRLENDGTLAPQAIEELCRKAQSAKILVIAGFMSPDNRMSRAAAVLKNCPNVYMMCETISNIHIKGNHHCIDSMLTVMTREEKEHMRPDIVISIGGALVSRFVKEYLRKITPQEHWTLGYTDTTVDCFLSITKRIEANPVRVLQKIGNHLIHAHRRNELSPAVASYASQWEQIKSRALISHTEYLSKLPWSDMKAYEAIFNTLPANYNLHLSNGTSIRYAQLLMSRQPHACFCNRGVSGIDGCTSTAIGGAIVYDKPTLLLSGDMSFAYDIGALALCRKTHSFKMIVINNGGGGIFRFIETTRDLDKREEYFCVPPILPLRELCLAYGIKYLQATSPTEMKSSLDALYKESEQPVLLEIVTPPELSAEILGNYMSRHKTSTKE